MDFFGHGAEIPRAIVGFLSSVTAFIGVLLAREERKKKANQATMQAIPESKAITDARDNPFRTDPSTAAKLLEANVSVVRATWEMDELRTRMTDVSTDARRTAAALVAAKAELDDLRAEKTALEAENERLRREARAADARAEAAIAELRTHKTGSTSTHSTTSPTAITPLIPKSRQK